MVIIRSHAIPCMEDTYIWISVKLKQEEFRSSMRICVRKNLADRMERHLRSFPRQAGT
jgi:hypothetical protein